VDWKKKGKHFVQTEVARVQYGLKAR
jgi:hypothetical protein